MNIFLVNLIIMDYKFLLTINIFEKNKIQSVLEESGIESILKDSYNMNLNAGWVDPYCNSNETLLFVKEKDFFRAKEILIDKLKIKF